jgi:hypothetical protein
MLCSSTAADASTRIWHLVDGFPQVAHFICRGMGDCLSSLLVNKTLYLGFTDTHVRGLTAEQLTQGLEAFPEPWSCCSDIAEGSGTCGRSERCDPWVPSGCLPVRPVVNANRTTMLQGTVPPADRERAGVHRHYRY